MIMTYQIGMTCSGLDETSSLDEVRSEIRRLVLDGGANVNAEYINISVIEAAIGSRSQFNWQIILLLIELGAQIPYTCTNRRRYYHHNHWRDITTLGLFIGDPFAASLLLHMPITSWCMPDDVRVGVHKTTWSELIPGLHPFKPSWSQIYEKEHKEPRYLFGHTVGVAGGHNWPIITVEAILCILTLEQGQQMLPWLIWAYGVRLERLPIIPGSCIHATSDLWSLLYDMKGWKLNTILDVLDARGYTTKTEAFNCETGK
jgi:hypothetical protein